MKPIDTTNQRAGLVDHPVRIRQDIAFLEVLGERDLELAEEERLAGPDLLLPDERRAVQPAAMRAAGIAQEHA